MDVGLFPPCRINFLFILFNVDNVRLSMFPILSTQVTRVAYKEFEDTKGVIRIRKSKKNRQHNGQKKKYKRTNNDLQNIHIKLKIE